MKPLPAQRYEYAEWLKAKVGIDYHVEADLHYYSVPHQLVGEYCCVFHAIVNRVSNGIVNTDSTGT